MVSDRSDRFSSYFKIGKYHWLTHGVWGINSNPRCGLQLLSRNVIMHVLFSAAVIVLVSVHRFLAGKSCILLNEGEGELALFSTRDNVLLTPLPSYSSTITLVSLKLRATRGACNPNLQVIITHVSTHALHLWSQHSFGLPLRMNGMHRTQFGHARFDYLPRKTYAKHSNGAKVFWPSIVVACTL